MQGWRIEVKAFPRLTEIGAWRGEGAERYGGFYTQDQARCHLYLPPESSALTLPLDLP